MRPRIEVPAPNRALTLVEVVLALGIVATVIIVVVGLFGSLMTQRRDAVARRETAAAAQSLPGFLNSEIPFSDVHDWLGSGSKALVFTQFAADSNGIPNPSGGQIRAAWFEVDALPPSLDAARQTPPIRAELEIDETLNPSGGMLDPLSSSTHAYMVARARLAPVSALDAPISEVSSVTIPLVISR